MTDLNYLDLSNAHLAIDAERPTYGWRKDGYTKRTGGAMEWRILCPLSKSWLRVYAICCSNVASYFVKAGGKRYFLHDHELEQAVADARKRQAAHLAKNTEHRRMTLP